MKTNLYMVALLLLIGTTVAQAQKIKFGKVSKPDFDEKYYAKDSTAKNFIDAAAYIGLDTAVPEKNFLFAMISSFTIENILRPKQLL